ncbi:hypothetical protein EDD21DRAFT_446816 [Dissophora ornata]|nr:hypothetical protein BGZ58_000930 [Dissophora ornata]KAI8597692.1 hypothetical protein EDD21DRAFT_446816 [Dissophora ornata]
MKTFNIDYEENSRLITSDHLKYQLAYFPIHFGGTSARGILAYGGADWTPTYPNWGTEKLNMPFGFLPVLTILHPEDNKKELILAENVAVDIFLAKQFGLHGENAWEEALINSFYSSSNMFFFQEIMFNFFWESSQKDEEEKKKYLEKFLNETLTDWGKTHEAHLKQNHQNGHYVGNRTTLADIRTTTMLNALEKIIGKERVASVINETNTPGVVKVRRNVESKPSYEAWTTSEEYKKLDVNSAAFVKDHHPELAK